MAISPINFYTTTYGVYRHILPPLVNTEEISRGMFRVPSPDPLTPSNTAYGTNANPILQGPRYISSAEYLEKNMVLQPAIEELNNEYETPIYQIDDGVELTAEELQLLISDTSEDQNNVDINIDNTDDNRNIIDLMQENNKLEQADKTSQNAVLQSLDLTNSLAASSTASNANVASQPETNQAIQQQPFYLETANYLSNVNYSSEYFDTLKSLAYIATLKNSDTTKETDGMIPVSAANLAIYNRISAPYNLEDNYIDKVSLRLTKFKSEVLHNLRNWWEIQKEEMKTGKINWLGIYES